MKIPEILNIGGGEVRVYIASISNDLHGFFEPSEGAIYLNTDNTPAQMTVTFWHEVIHAINHYNRLQVELSAELEAMREDNANPDVRALLIEERIAEDFARVFVQVIKDNNLLEL